MHRQTQSIGDLLVRHPLRHKTNYFLLPLAEGLDFLILGLMSLLFFLSDTQFLLKLLNCRNKQMVLYKEMTHQILLKIDYVKQNGTQQGISFL